MNFTYLADQTNGVGIMTPTNLRPDAQPPANGPRMTHGTSAQLDAANWAVVTTGQFGPLGGAPGIYTVGQFNCLCVIIASITPGNGLVTNARLAHISAWQSGIVNNMAAQIPAGQNVYVIIAAKNAMSAGMGNLRAKLQAQPFGYTNFFLYEATILDGERMGFGLGADGLIGQVQ